MKRISELIQDPDFKIPMAKEEIEGLHNYHHDNYFMANTGTLKDKDLLLEKLKHISFVDMTYRRI